MCFYFSINVISKQKCQCNNSDEAYDRNNLARPVAYRGSFSHDSGIMSNNADGIYDDDVVLRNLDGFERTLANAYRLYNLGDELNRKRIYLEQQQQQQRHLNNFNAHHRLPIAQQIIAQQPKDQSQNQVFSQETAALNQHQLKRAIDPIGGANLLKRAVDRLGGGNLLKRR